MLVVDAVIKMATGPLAGVFASALALVGWSLVKKDSDPLK